MTFKLATMTAAMAVLALTPACAESKAAPAADREAVEKVVRDYILENPEIIEEALIKLADRQRAEAAKASQDAIMQNYDALYNHADDHFIGPADAEITLVEFFDYRCGYCKRSVDWVQNLPEEYDGKVRVVFKELPIFGGISETAALAALAAGKQGKYNEYHVALMKLKNNDDLTESKLDEIAKDHGIDVKKMRADMRSMEIQKQLSDMKQLGRTLGVDGTPGFFMGDNYIEGANTPRIIELIEGELDS
ncbi:DsbA family protein [Hyphomonas pacifica]|uniref:Uncharacterized protein n=1 Tax=Hyphomonas pacifica TaxID=1280941 RepID=A0A062TTK6_9PROT|nr:DsbA family protein [Hyphomonas pacifica]KCZ46757.1 hypothetical protein HY2_05050 [Hyphomonas pacifica]RAN30373.1 hypothetical protein HY3_06020 [Hyphomonas pacifica]RAN31759.1 hypothetical protein HY11_06110 [Hyphomonas pacifica]